MTKDALWSQFGAGLAMLENAIHLSPDEHWDTGIGYMAYHCTFWTDYYLSTEPGKFEPPAPFTFSEFDPGEKPERTYAKAEVHSYLEHCREKSHQLIIRLNAEQLNSRWVNAYKDYSLLEMLLYNMRHIQHHAAQLNLLLRQRIDKAPAWVSQVMGAEKA